MRLPLATALAAAASLPTPTKANPHPQPPSTTQDLRAAEVIAQFRHAWHGYRAHAFPHDDLLPKNDSFSDSRNGWGLTAVDALSTAIVMEQGDIVGEILGFVPTVDFTQNQAREPYGEEGTSVFETTIRYLGGMLSAYDLLTGPFAGTVCEEDVWKVDALLAQAVVLADTIKLAFDTPTGIPVNTVFIDNKTFAETNRMEDGTWSAGLAEMGTLVLEWQRLSDLTGDPSYGELAQKAESYWFSGKEIWPGLTGGNFSVETGEIINKYGGWTSGNDSAYEYLIKMYAYDPSRYANYSQRWQLAADSTLAHLLRHPSSCPDLTFPGTFASKAVQNYTEALACFIRGNFLLASTTLPNTTYAPPGLAFAEFCANGYRTSPSAIGPTLYSWNTSLLATENYTNQTALYARAGWFIPDNTVYRGGQAPEAVESWYYAYRATQDPYWRDVAWNYTLAQNATLRVGSGFASLDDVLVEGGTGGTGNFMASFMLAEVLKYQYLIQREEAAWEGQFVFNTEAHPLRKVGVGRGKLGIFRRCLS